MLEFRFGTSVIFKILIVLVTTINYGNLHSVEHGKSHSILEDEDLLHANVTMTNIMTTRVYRMKIFLFLPN